MNPSKQNAQTAFSLLIAILSAPDEKSKRELLLGIKHHQFTALLKQIQWHRIAVIFHQTIKQHHTVLPPSFINPLSKLRAIMHKRSLCAIYELERISDKFSKNSIRFFVFKGIVLSQQLYGSPIMRSGKDIDLLISPEDIVQTHNYLLELGYLHIHPQIEPGTRAFTHYMSRQKDAVYFSANKSVEIEVHWRLDINPLSMPFDFDLWWSRRSPAHFKNFDVNTFSKIDAYCHFAMHGSISMWGRLCWLYDWWIMVTLDDDFDWSLFHQISSEQGLERMVDLPMQLIKLVFDATLPTPYDSLKEDRKVHTMKQLILSNLPQNKYPPAWRRVISRTSLKTNLNYKLSYLNNAMRMLIARERSLIPR